MAHPTKRRGYRQIVCGAHTYRWRFVAGAEQGTLTVVPDGRSGQRLLVALPDHRDPWLRPWDVRPLPAPVIPSFVVRAIAHGLEAGWSPQAPGGPFRLALT
ncbi:hypothetical protein [Deinococcus arenicola]|uniref:DUF2442 domain-containing protein n=1 Tax=Deinococcus arenicola TaxID=2994950 RepID=A0ABU4DU67_9DEIO|nr:hypothetical protein [Deinococcus sp. ZS9-10]MDV6375977.1 hypothetical protein [Deinococcus sp. ZS9-10]